MNPACAKHLDGQKPQSLREAELAVVQSETALRYLPLFDHLPLPEPQKLQLIADLLTVIDHTFDVCLAPSNETPSSS